MQRLTSEIGAWVVYNERFLREIRKVTHCTPKENHGYDHDCLLRRRSVTHDAKSPLFLSHTDGGVSYS